jgi:hypothetical protein
MVMNELQIKFNSLDAPSQKEVMDFIDFLAEKLKRSKKSTADKDHLLAVSTWSNEDIKAIEQAQALIKFQAEEW